MKNHWLQVNPQVVATATSPAEIARIYLKENETDSRNKYAQLFFRLFPELEHISPTAVVLAIASLLTALAVTGVLAVALHIPLPGIIERALPGLSIGSDFSADRNAFLARMEKQQLKRLAAKVHFVTEIIRTTNRRVASDAKKLAYAIVVESERAGVDPFLVASVIKTESTFRRAVRSHVGALGLMQLLPTTGQYIARKRALDWKGTHSLTDPHTNIQLGIAYLQYLEKKFGGNLHQALIAYNWGPGHLIRARKAGNRPPSSTVKYATGIIGTHQKWSSEYQAREHEYRYINPNFLFS